MGIAGLWKVEREQCRWKWVQAISKEKARAEGDLNTEAEEERGKWNIARLEK
jgi:hypothetical protein